MVSKEYLRQREIGQQMMIVRMVHSINDTVSRVCYTFLGKDDLLKWSSISKEELDVFLDTIAMLDKITLCADAAKEYARDLSGDADLFFSVAFRKYGSLYIYDKMREEGEHMTDLFKRAYNNAIRMNQEGFKVDEELQTTERFYDSLEFYSNFYFSRIAQALNNGYDWDVVFAMLRENEEFCRHLKLWVG